MKKINLQELGLLIKSQEYKPFDNKWLDEAIMLLIKQRAEHCKAQLDRAMAKDEAYLCNNLDSQYIIYVDNDSNEYGHFGTPTYNHMIDYLEGGLPYDKMIVQQALRQYLYITNLIDRIDNRFPETYCITADDIYFDKEISELKQCLKGKTMRDLENKLTEMMLIL